jgi:hypothetical protein
MSEANASGEIEFPWLPGEAHILPDPAFTYGMIPSRPSA